MSVSEFIWPSHRQFVLGEEETPSSFPATHNGLDESMQNNTAKTICTCAIWLAVATVLTFGVFRMTWDGISGLFVLPMAILIICGMAGYATSEVWKQPQPPQWP